MLYLLVRRYLSYPHRQIEVQRIFLARISKTRERYASQEFVCKTLEVNYTHEQVLNNFITFRPKVGLNFVDHIVGNQPDKEMEPVAKWYIK